MSTPPSDRARDRRHLVEPCIGPADLERQWLRLRGRLFDPGAARPRRFRFAFVGLVVLVLGGTAAAALLAGRGLLHRSTRATRASGQSAMSTPASGLGAGPRFARLSARPRHADEANATTCAPGLDAEWLEAVPAGDLVERVGINVRMSHGGPYAVVGAVRARIERLGMRYVIDEARSLTALGELADNRLRIHVWINGGDSVRRVSQVLGGALVGLHVGANDSRGQRLAWMPHAAAINEERRKLLLEDVVLVGPSIGAQRSGAARALPKAFGIGDLVDAGAYSPPPHAPYTEEGQLVLEASRTLFDGKPLFVPQAGFSTASVSEAVQAKYLVRVLLVQLEAGIRRTFISRLLDEGAPSPNSRGFGLLHSDFSVKPSFEAIEALLGRLADPGPPLDEGAALPVRFPAAPANLRRLLFARRGGGLVLALWLERPSLDADQEETVTVQLPVDVASVRRWQLPAKSQEDQLDVSEGTLSVAASDRVTFLELTSACTRRPAAP